MSDEKLSAKVKAGIAFNAVVQLIPYAGGPISSVWSGIQQERVNKRVDNFHQKIIADIEGLRNKRIDSAIDPALIEDLILKVYEKVETEASETKLERLRRFLTSSLQHPPIEDFDERVTFLNDLADISELECGVLSFLASNSAGVKVRDLQSEGVSQYAFVGAIERLRGKGFLVSRRGEFMMNGQHDEALGAIVSVSDYGNKFVAYCLS
jgi:hypothetical protein